MPSYTFASEASKLRYKEPYASEGQNLKDSGIIPAGIYNGYTPLSVGGNLLLLDVDPIRGDSVAVVETRIGMYNLTVRRAAQIPLDFTGFVAFPSLVVLRTDYSIISPVTGTTVSQILVVDPTLNDALPTHLNTGDVKICRVTGNVAGVITYTIVPGVDRNDNGGSLVRQADLTGATVQFAAQRAVAGGSFSVGSGTFTDVTGLYVDLTPTSSQDVLALFTGTAEQQNTNCKWRIIMTRTAPPPPIVTPITGGATYNELGASQIRTCLAGQDTVSVVAGSTYRFQVQIAQWNAPNPWPAILRRSTETPATLTVIYKG